MKILFVCTGNTCRSPMAEGLFNNCKNQEFISSSAGISVIKGSEVSRNSIEALKEYNIDISNHIPRQITLDLIKEFDLIVTMSKHHKDFLSSFYPQYTNKIHCISEYTCGDDIFDPYGCDLEVYKMCASQINTGINNLIEALKDA